MIVAFDATVLIYIIDENASPPNDPATGQPVRNCKERLDHLPFTLQKENAKIIIPTPALGEVLVKAQQAAPELLRDLTSSKHFRVVSFDAMAAVEYAAMHAARLGSPPRTGRKSSSTSRSLPLPEWRMQQSSIRMMETSRSWHVRECRCWASPRSRFRPPKHRATCSRRSKSRIHLVLTLDDGANAPTASSARR